MEPSKIHHLGAYAEGGPGSAHVDRNIRLRRETDPTSLATKQGSASARIAVQLLLEEQLHLVEELHAVLLHNDCVRRLAEHDEPLRRRAGEKGEQGLRHVG